MTRSTFNLIDEPWIVVRLLDGSVETLSLRETFTRAEEIRGITGDGPTQDVAILRLLLSILLRSIGDPDDPLQTWGDLWRGSGLPSKLIDQYLDQHHGRFDLLDPQQPFFQIAPGATVKRSGILKLIPDVPDTPEKQHFTTRAGAGVSSISLEEAARWVVHTQAFDASGIKTGVPGDPRVKGGKGYPLGVAWSGNCGVLMVEGESLRETLLLNSILDDVRQADVPPWERPHDTAAPREASAGVEVQPLGPVQALTWQSRRIVLHFSDAGDRVVDVTIGYGDKLAAQNRMSIEPFTAWRLSKNKSKKGKPIYFPQSVDPERAMWRGMSSLLARAYEAKGRVTGEQPDAYGPRVLSWLADLRRDEQLAEDFPIRLHLTGVSYGTQQSIIDTVVSDELLFPAAVLEDASLQELARHAVNDAESAASALRGLARNLTIAQGDDGAPATAAGGRAAQRLYAELGRQYRTWLGDLLPHADADALRARWQATVQRESDRLAADLVRQAGRTAVVGRNHGGRHLDAGLASLWYQAALRKALDRIPAPAVSRETNDA